MKDAKAHLAPESILVVSVHLSGELCTWNVSMSLGYLPFDLPPISQTPPYVGES